MRIANVLDPVQDALPASVWDHPAAPEPKLKPIHSDFIKSNVYEILEQNGYTKPHEWLKLYLTGSLCTYQYGPGSDCDVSLFVDSTVFPEWSRAEMIGLMIENTEHLKLPGTPYPLQAYVVSKSLHPSDLYKPHIRSGYDIDQDKWLVPPDPSMAHDPAVQDNGFYVWALEKADSMERLLRYEPRKAELLWHQIHARRMLDERLGKGDMSEANLVYKMLHKRGLVPQIAALTGEHIAASVWNEPSGETAYWDQTYNPPVPSTEWYPGMEGKGFFDFGGQPHVWAVNTMGQPFHDEYANEHAVEGIHSPIEIAPSGHYTTAYGWEDPDISETYPKGWESDFASKVPGLKYVPSYGMYQKNKDRGRYGKTASTIAALALHGITSDGGITIGLNGEKPRAEGYALSMVKDAEVQVPLKQISAHVIDKYIAQYMTDLAQPGNYLGAWVANGIVYLDISHIEPDFDKAMQKAQAAHQLAFYDLANEKDVPVDRDGQTVVSYVSHQQVLDANAGQDLEGLPGAVNVPGYGPLQFHGNADLQRIANEYNQANGLGSHPTNYSPVDPQIGQQIAQEYERMPHTPRDPTTQQAYEALANETKAQYDALANNGYRFEFYPPDRDPYPNSPREAVLDVAQNKHMYVYPTSTGYGMGDEVADHPLLTDSGVRWNGQPVMHNDLFRAVHDAFGHAKEGVGFRQVGEDNAYRQHAAMFSQPARAALASETRGQNSWVNFGPHGDQNQTANQAETVYAPQKAGLMPEWVADPDLHMRNT